VLSVVVLVVVYYNLPLDREFDATASVTLLLAGLGALTGLFVWQVRASCGRATRRCGRSMRRPARPSVLPAALRRGLLLMGKAQPGSFTGRDTGRLA
jgi:hypothetical protein